MSATGTPAASRWPAATGLASALGVALVAACLIAALGTERFRFTSDSAAYLEQARSLLAGRPVVEIMDGYVLPAYQPGTNFPIGFPVGIYLLARLGLDPLTAALTLNGLGALLVPLVPGLLLRKVVAPWQVAVLSLAAITPGLLYNASFGLTDSLATALMLAGACAVLRGTPAWVFLAGLFAGAAYAIRNVHLALIASLYLYALAMVWRQPARWRPSMLLWLTLGLAPAVLPVLVRNLSLFGQLNPYHLDHSTIGVVENLRTYVKELAEDATGSVWAGRWLGWSIPGLAAVALGLTAVALSAWREYLEADDGRPCVIGWALMLALFGSTIVIAARTRYWWGETINSRHVFPYVGLLVLAVLSAVHRVLPAGLRWRHGVLAVVALLLASRSAMAWAELVALQQEPAVRRQQIYTDGAAWMCNPGARHVVSNQSYIFRILCAAPARYVFVPDALAGAPWEARREGLVGELIALPSRLGKPLTVLLAPGHGGVEAGNLPLGPAAVQRLEAAGYTVERDDAKLTVLRFEAR